MVLAPLWDDLYEQLGIEGSTTKRLWISGEVMPTDPAEAEASVDVAPNGAPEDNVDDARQAAAGTRRTARWLASALGAIPSIGLNSHADLRRLASKGCIGGGWLSVFSLQLQEGLLASMRSQKCLRPCR